MLAAMIMRERYPGRGASHFVRMAEVPVNRPREHGERAERW